MTTWATEGTSAATWNTESGLLSQLGSVGSVGSVTQSIQLLDNASLSFGSDADYSISYDSTQDRLEFNNVSGDTLISLTTTGLLLDSVRLVELSSLPTATEGSLVYYNNDYYLGFPD
mgnify:CR=1 FL=1|jgi:hypothetical protein|tara:strand:- start:102 stop:452 length:351 start_codon:yes stop_codon:yes gene_type:complete